MYDLKIDREARDQLLQSTDHAMSMLLGQDVCNSHDTARLARKAAQAFRKIRSAERASANLVDKRELLKIKLKSLAYEIRAIRRAMRTTWGPLWAEMRDHVSELSSEARETGIAYALIRGVPLELVDDGVFDTPRYVDFQNVHSMVLRYGRKGQVKPLTSKNGPAQWAEARDQLKELDHENAKAAVEKHGIVLGTEHPTIVLSDLVAYGGLDLAQKDRPALPQA